MRVLATPREAPHTGLENPQTGTENPPQGEEGAPLPDFSCLGPPETAWETSSTLPVFLLPPDTVTVASLASGVVPQAWGQGQVSGLLAALATHNMR